MTKLLSIAQTSFLPLFKSVVWTAYNDSLKRSNGKALVGLRKQVRLAIQHALDLGFGDVEIEKLIFKWSRGADFL